VLETIPPIIPHWIITASTCNEELEEDEEGEEEVEEEGEEEVEEEGEVEGEEEGEVEGEEEEQEVELHKVVGPEYCQVQEVSHKVSGPEYCQVKAHFAEGLSGTHTSPELTPRYRVLWEGGRKQSGLHSFVMAAPLRVRQCVCARVSVSVLYKCVLTSRNNHVNRAHA
jgi:hypothetical protein